MPFKIRLCGHLRRYKKIVKKTYMISIYGYAKIEQKGEAGGNLKPEKYAG